MAAHIAAPAGRRAQGEVGAIGQNTRRVVALVDLGEAAFRASPAFIHRTEHEHVAHPGRAAGGRQPEGRALGRCGARFGRTPQRRTGCLAIAPAARPIARHGRVREPTTIVPLGYRGGIGRRQEDVAAQCVGPRAERLRLGRQRDRCAIAPRTSRRPDCARGPIDGLTPIARPGRSANGSAWLTLRALGRRMPPGPDRRADAAGAAALLSVCSRTPPNPWPKRVSIDVPAPGSVSASLSDAPHEQPGALPQQLGATRPAWSAVSAIFHLRRRRICRSAGAAPWRWRAGGGHARELVGDAVRLMLERVVDLSEDELRCMFGAPGWMRTVSKRSCSRSGCSI